METPNPIIGATYNERSTGRDFELAGLRIGSKVVMIHGAQGPSRTVSTLGIEEWRERFEHSHCNHDEHCCTVHGQHSTPHRGCLMR